MSFNFGDGAISAKVEVEITLHVSAAALVEREYRIIEGGPGIGCAVGKCEVCANILIVAFRRSGVFFTCNEVYRFDRIFRGIVRRIIRRIIRGIVRGFFRRRRFFRGRRVFRGRGFFGRRGFFNSFAFGYNDFVDECECTVDGNFDLDIACLGVISICNTPFNFVAGVGIYELAERSEVAFFGSDECFDLSRSFDAGLAANEGVNLDLVNIVDIFEIDNNGTETVGSVATEVAGVSVECKPAVIVVKDVGSHTVGEVCIVRAGPLTLRVNITVNAVILAESEVVYGFGGKYGSVSVFSSSLVCDVKTGEFNLCAFGESGHEGETPCAVGAGCGSAVSSPNETAFGNSERLGNTVSRSYGNNFVNAGFAFNRLEGNHSPPREAGSCCGVINSKNEVLNCAVSVIIPAYRVESCNDFVVKASNKCGCFISVKLLVAFGTVGHVDTGLFFGTCLFCNFFAGDVTCDVGLFAAFAELPVIVVIVVIIEPIAFACTFVRIFRLVTGRNGRIFRRFRRFGRIFGRFVTGRNRRIFRSRRIFGSGRIFGRRRIFRRIVGRIYGSFGNFISSEVHTLKINIVHRFKLAVAVNVSNVELFFRKLVSAEISALCENVVHRIDFAVAVYVAFFSLCSFVRKCEDGSEAAENHQNCERKSNESFGLSHFHIFPFVNLFASILYHSKVRMSTIYPYVTFIIFGRFKMYTLHKAIRFSPEKTKNPTVFHFKFPIYSIYV